MHGALSLAAVGPFESTGVATAAGIAVITFTATLMFLDLGRRRRNRRRGSPPRPPRQDRTLPMSRGMAEVGARNPAPPRGAAAGRPEPKDSPGGGAGGRRASQLLTQAAKPPQGVALSDWAALVREVAAEEGILAETRGRLSSRRSLQSLLATLRDRDLLHERGERIGRQIFAQSYADFGDRLTRNNVCAEAQFRKAPGEAIHVRLVQTSMAKDAPVIGTCVCFIEAGLIAGGLSNLEKRPVSVREVRCLAKGDPLCEFRAEPGEEEEPVDWTADVSGLTGKEEVAE